MGKCGNTQCDGEDSCKVDVIAHDDYREPYCEEDEPGPEPRTRTSWIRHLATAQSASGVQPLQDRRFSNNLVSPDEAAADLETRRANDVIDDDLKQSQISAACSRWTSCPSRSPRNRSA